MLNDIVGVATSVINNSSFPFYVFYFYLKIWKYQAIVVTDAFNFLNAI